MLWIMLKKDLARVAKTPGKYLLMLAMPVAIAGLIGLAFGGGGNNLPPIKIGYVDEDQALLGGAFASALSRSPLEIELFPMTFDAAMAQLNKNKLNAVIRVPKEFTTHYFSGKTAPAIELVKNPTDRYLAAIVEEMLLLFQEALNAVSHNLSGELSEIREAINTEKAPDPLVMAGLTSKVFKKVENAEDWLFPPLIGFHAVEEGTEPKEEVNVFATLLPGLAGLFLLFLADMGVRDLFTEKELKTAERFIIINGGSAPMVVSKCLLAMMIVILGALILLWGAGALFGIIWKNSFIMLILVLAYGLCCAGLMAALSAFLGSEKKANVLNAGVLMTVGFLGGSMLPIENLPTFVAQNLSPHMPNYWLSRSILNLQYGMDGPLWSIAAVKMAVVGIVFLVIAAFMLNRQAFAGVKS